KQRFPYARVKARAVSDKVVFLEGTVDTATEAQEIEFFVKQVTGAGGQVINSMYVIGSQQVQLEVCISVVNRTALRQLALNCLYSSPGVFFGNLTGNNVLQTPLPAVTSTGAGPGTITSGPLVSQTSNLFFGLTQRGFNLFGVIAILQSQGMAKLLASPT